MGLTKTVAREFAGRNILCNAVAPGFVASDMTAALDPKYEAQIFKTIPLGTPCPQTSIVNKGRFLIRLQACKVENLRCELCIVEFLAQNPKTLAKPLHARPARPVRAGGGGGGHRQVPGAGPLMFWTLDPS